MNFKQFVSDAGTALNRAVQKTEEKLGQAEKTEYDAHFENLLLRADQTQQWSEKMIAATEAVLQPNPATRMEDLVFDKLEKKKRDRNNVAEDLGDTFINASQDLGPNTPYGLALLKCGQAEQKIGQAQREYIHQVSANFLVPLRDFLENDMKNIAKERRTLENLRLDLDSVKSKVKRIRVEAAKKSNDEGVAKAEDELLKSQQDFDRQVEVTKLLLEGVRGSHTQHRKALSELVECQMNYFAQCHQYMQDVHNQMDIST